MHDNSDCWLGPRPVETPNIVEDVSKFIDPDMSPERFRGGKDENRRRLILVTERLELIDHFQVVLQQLKKRKKTTRTCKKEEGDKFAVEEVYDIVLWNHQFAGFDFDLDSLCIYLYLTCIDTIKGQPEHVDAFDWLASLNHEAIFRETPVEWKTLQDEYRQQYGLSRRFKEAFTVDLRADTKELLTKYLAVVKIGDQCIKPDSWKAWKKRQQPEKVGKIADQLYTIRSSFTHASLRTFSPEIPISGLASSDSTLILRSDGPRLPKILNSVVTELAKSLLM